MSKDLDSTMDSEQLENVSDEDDEEYAEGEYSFDKIFTKRIRNGNVEYLLKWNNYSADQCTWEPPENVTSNEVGKTQAEAFEESLVDEMANAKGFDELRKEIKDAMKNYQSVDYSQVKIIDRSNDYPKLTPRQFHGYHKTSDAVYFVMAFDEIPHQVLVKSNVLYMRWPHFARQFYDEIHKDIYSFRYRTFSKVT